MADYNYDSTLGRSNRETQTPADIFDVVYNSESTFDLPIEDTRLLVNDLMIHQIGTKVLVDGQTEFILTSDLRKRYSNLHNNMKDCSFLHATRAKRGSIVTFPNESQALVFDIPNDDIVSYSARIVVFNNRLDFFRPEVTYDEDPKSPTYGDEISFLLRTEKSIPVFIEKVDGYLKNQDVGLLHDSVYKVIGSQEMITANVEDVVRVADKYYEISDIDKLTSGICVLQLRSSRNEYDKYVVK